MFCLEQQKLEKRTFNDDLVVISKEVKRLYINVNPSKWKSINYRNIHSWCYSIIGKHSSVHTGTADFEYFIRNCHSLSDYIVITKPFHATQPFIRIEILIFQGQERQVFSSNLTISNYNFEFVPRPLFVADARKYEDACRHIEKKGRWKYPKFAALVILRVFRTVYPDNKSFEANRLYDAAKRPERLTELTFENQQVSVLCGPYCFVVDH